MKLQIITDLSISVAGGLIILIVQVIIRAIIKVRRQRGENDSELSALLSLGRFMWFILIGICIYGFITRPIFSKEKLRDEVAVIKAGDMILYDMDLRRGSRDVITLDFEVKEGGPVRVELIPMPSKHATTLGNKHIPSFSIVSAESGNKSARVEPGLWSIALSPSSDVRTSLTKIHVKTYVSRPRFFQKVNSAVPME